MLGTYYVIEIFTHTERERIGVMWVWVEALLMHLVLGGSLTGIQGPGVRG